MVAQRTFRNTTLRAYLINIYKDLFVGDLQPMWLVLLDKVAGTDDRLIDYSYGTLRKDIIHTPKNVLLRYIDALDWVCYELHTRNMRDIHYNAVLLRDIIEKYC